LRFLINCPHTLAIKKPQNCLLYNAKGLIGAGSSVWQGRAEMGCVKVELLKTTCFLKDILYNLSMVLIINLQKFMSTLTVEIDSFVKSQVVNGFYSHKARENIIARLVERDIDEKIAEGEPIQIRKMLYITLIENFVKKGVQVFYATNNTPPDLSTYGDIYVRWVIEDGKIRRQNKMAK
jgi:hypothetical protein